MQPSHAADLVSHLKRCKFLLLTRREFDWVLELDHDTQIVVGCIWRLIEAGRIRWTSEDHGHKFGLPAPVDAAAEVNKRIAGRSISRAELRAGTLDLDLHIDTGCVLQIIPSSAGYESWNVSSPIGCFVSVGGGELSVLPPPHLER